VTRGAHDKRAAGSWPSSAHEARRFVLGHLPESIPIEGSPTEADRLSRAEEPPELLPPAMLEGESFTAVEVGDPRMLRGISGFSAFLDGAQDIRVVNQVAGIPIVWATVSAAIRARENRRLVSWNGRHPIVSGRYYIPFRYVDRIAPEFRSNPRVVDTGLPDAKGNVPSRHPAALMEAAVKRVQGDRDRIEQQLGEEWCASGDGVLYVDGSVTSSRTVSTSSVAVGVIKSHRRLYADGDAFPVLVGLAAGHRSTMFKVEPNGRHPVASWYVRVRPPAGRDALFGLVRVEAALDSATPDRANEISRWIIAEGSPLALPDGRWDKMSYGIRHTEEFLRAIS
jgi:hypothetical protein